MSLRGEGMSVLNGLDGLDEVCEKALAEHGCPSVSVAVAQGDELVFARAYGRADPGTDRAAGPETVYGLASVTKSFTALAVCLAADRGLLDLDAPLSGAHRWAPTARQLMRHRGGFPAYYDFHYGDRPGPIDPGAYRRQVREPGGGFEYSNHGYHVLGGLLEEATGRPLRTFLREQLAEPLGLASFEFGDAYPGSGPVAVRCTADGRAYPDCWTSHPAAGAGWATAGDVALFARRSAGLLRPETAAAVLDGLPITDRLGYGFGRIVQREGGAVISSHGGGMGGVAAMMIDLPDRGLSLAVLTNSTNKAARDAVVRHLMAAQAPEFDPGHLQPVSDPARELTLSPGSWAGVIDAPEGGIPVQVDLLDDRRVRLRLADHPPVTVPAAASRQWDVQFVADVQLPTADARLNSPSVGLALRADGDGLTGRAVAFKNGDHDGLLGPFLVHPCRLRPAG
ncbi:serine hydrolase domain-containing protein [Kitasatospora sp. NPDC059646]|uniref:serine hydrolase domain-containing protein n=1 Tax=Kitasatospora sp. NPDC059646 TaxID=3346893 RepID=UPI003697F298